MYITCNNKLQYSLQEYKCTINIEIRHFGETNFNVFCRRLVLQQKLDGKRPVDYHLMAWLARLQFHLKEETLSCHSWIPVPDQKCVSPKNS